MKQILLNSLITLVISVTVCAVYVKYKSPKYAFVKSGVLLNDYKGMQLANEQFNAELSKVQANLDTLKKRAEAIASLKPASEKENGEWNYRMQIAGSEYEKYMQNSQKQMAEKKAELTGSVLKEVNDFVQAYGKENGYKYIFGTTNEGSILYGDEAEEITSILTKELNEAFDKKQGK